jgi:16S rRNA G1207 methylase RsmC
MEHYFSEKPRSSFIREKFSTTIKGEEFIINSGSGIFSTTEIDKGSRLIVENAKIVGKNILDLGCGYGIIGIAMKRFHPDSEVLMVDINERAVRMAKENCSENNVECAVLKSDIFSNLKNSFFDVILTNPPFSAGKNVCKEFIRQSYLHLNKGGTLQLVAPHNKGGESLKKYMLEVFGNAGELSKKSGYRVYISIKQ